MLSLNVILPSIFLAISSDNDIFLKYYASHFLLRDFSWSYCLECADDRGVAADILWSWDWTSIFIMTETQSRSLGSLWLCWADIPAQYYLPPDSIYVRKWIFTYLSCCDWVSITSSQIQFIIAKIKTFYTLRNTRNVSVTAAMKDTLVTAIKITDVCTLWPNYSISGNLSQR